jgi:hypothetical protein
MKILLHSRVASPSLIGRYRFAEQRLREAGFDSQIRTGVEPGVGADAGDVLVSHNCVAPEERERLGNRCFGGKRMTRPEHLTLLASLGFPTMDWTTAKNQMDALALFDSLEAPRLILKRSFTGGGTGFHVLTKNQPRYTEWDYENDIICKEVNPDDGFTYKAELFAGKLMLGFVLKKAPLRERLGAGDTCPKGVRQLAVYRNDRERPDERHRSLFEFSENEKVSLENLSASLTQLGFGYVSVDLMRRPDGQLVAIEINTGSVTTWWSETFPFVRERFAAALLNLVKQI